MFWEEKKIENRHQRNPSWTKPQPSLLFPLCTFNRSLKLFLHAGPSRAAIIAEGLHPEQVGCPWSQVNDFYKILLQNEHNVGGHIQVIVLIDRKKLK